MRSIEMLIEGIRKLGGKVIIDGVNLRCRAPKGFLTPELISEMEAKKSEIITVMRITGNYGRSFHDDSAGLYPHENPTNPTTAEPTDIATHSANIDEDTLEWIQERAQKLQPTRLFDLVYDPAVPHEEREIYRQEIHRRASQIIEEYEVRISPPNKAVHDMFKRESKGYADCGNHRHWQSTSGVLVCGICHPPAYPELVAEWIPNREESFDV